MYVMAHRLEIYAINAHISLTQDIYKDQTLANVNKAMYKFVILVYRLAELMVLMILQNAVLALTLIKIVECV